MGTTLEVSLAGELQTCTDTQEAQGTGSQDTDVYKKNLFSLRHILSPTEVRNKDKEIEKKLHHPEN